jgi:hypothetical protein
MEEYQAWRLIVIGKQERWQEDLFVAGPLSSLIPEERRGQTPLRIRSRFEIEKLCFKKGKLIND